MDEFLNKGMSYNKLNEYQKHKVDWLREIDIRSKKTYLMHLTSNVNCIELEDDIDLYDWSKEEIIKLFKSTPVKSRKYKFTVISKYIKWACDKGLNCGENPCDNIGTSEVFEVQEYYQNQREFYDFLFTLDCTDVDRAMIALIRYGATVDNVGIIKWNDINEHDKILNITEKGNIMKLPIDDEFIMIINKAKLCMNKTSHNKDIDYYDNGYVVKKASNVKWQHANAISIYNIIKELSIKSGIDRINVRDLRNARVYDLLFEIQKENGIVTNDDIEKVLTLIQDGSMSTKTNRYNSGKINEFRKRFQVISDIEVEKRKTGKRAGRTIGEQELDIKERDNCNNDLIDSEEIKDIEDDFNNIDIESMSIEEKYRNDFIKTRIGQGKFRDALIKRHGCKCDICGLDIKELLIASHIKEYVYCENNEHIDLANGLLLCPNHDKLFDRHLISFNSDGKIMFSESINTNNYEQLNINKDIIIDKDLFKEEYMSYHREKIV